MRKRCFINYKEMGKFLCTMFEKEYIMLLFRSMEIFSARGYRLWCVLKFGLFTCSRISLDLYPFDPY